MLNCVNNWKSQQTKDILDKHFQVELSSQILKHTLHKAKVFLAQFHTPDPSVPFSHLPIIYKHIILSGNILLLSKIPDALLPSLYKSFASIFLSRNCCFQFSGRIFIYPLKKFIFGKNEPETEILVISVTEIFRRKRETPLEIFHWKHFSIIENIFPAENGKIFLTEICFTARNSCIMCGDKIWQNLQNKHIRLKVFPPETFHRKISAENFPKNLPCMINSSHSL